jgi:hypothetical protein
MKKIRLKTSFFKVLQEIQQDFEDNALGIF